MGNSHSSEGKDSGLLKDEVHDATINLLLLGRTGTGKSTTGNNILQYECFNTDDSDSLVTTKCQCKNSRYNGTDIKVVDMPGLGDNSKKEDENLKIVVKAAKDAVAETPDGFDALLVVTEFGRQSREHKAAVDQLKVIFGQDIFSQFGILIVTYGDNFKRRKDSTQTFEEICSQQTGQLHELWKDCNKRAVLFDNVTENPEEKEVQRRKLFDLVEGMRQRKRYTPELFEAAEAKRDELIKMTEQSVLTEAIKKELRVIMHDLNGTDVNKFDESNEKLVEIRERVAALIANRLHQPENIQGRENIVKFSKSLEAAIEMKHKLAHKLGGMSAGNEKENYKDVCRQDNSLDEENIEDMKKKMADKESELEEEFRGIFDKNAKKGDLGIFLLASAGTVGLGYICGGVPGCVFSLGAAFSLAARRPDFVSSVFERLKDGFDSFR